MCVTNDGHIYAWGANPSKCLGTGKADKEVVPRRVGFALLNEKGV
jgi:hypothetical protein